MLVTRRTFLTKVVLIISQGSSLVEISLRLTGKVDTKSWVDRKRHPLRSLLCKDIWPNTAWHLQWDGLKECVFARISLSLRRLGLIKSSWLFVVLLIWVSPTTLNQSLYSGWQDFVNRFSRTPRGEIGRVCIHLVLLIVGSFGCGVVLAYDRSCLFIPSKFTASRLFWIILVIDRRASLNPCSPSIKIRTTFSFALWSRLWFTFEVSQSVAFVVVIDALSTSCDLAVNAVDLTSTLNFSLTQLCIHSLTFLCKFLETGLLKQIRHW